MEPGSKKRNAFFFLLHLLYLVFFTSIIFSLRAYSSISIAGILITGLFGYRWTYYRAYTKKAVLFFLAGCISFFLLILAAMLYTQDTSTGWDQLRLKTGLVVTPLAVFFTSGFISQYRKRLILYFILILSAAALFCLVISTYRFFRLSDPDVFFYHELVYPISQHAVYFSVFVFIALVLLLETMGNGASLFPRIYALLLIVFFSFFLFLLSSKLAIVLYGLYLVFFILRSARVKMIRRPVALGLLFLLLSVIAMILLTKNPLNNRFRDIIEGDISITKKENFEPGDYFNGVQLRLLEWRFVSEILSENKKWFLGVGPGDAQNRLDQKYISKNMYTGEPGRHDRGFLGYNTHNQFLESLLQLGIIGAIIFTLTWLALLYMAWVKKSRQYSVIVIFLLVYAGVESILETQYGIIIFTFMPLFFYTAITPKPDVKPGNNAN